MVGARVYAPRQTHSKIKDDKNISKLMMKSWRWRKGGGAAG